MAKSGIVITSDTLTPNLKKFAPEVDRVVSESINYFFPTVQGYAQTSAPWTDRTGNARQTLRAVPFHKPMSSHGIWVAHGMPYGIWLETRFSGKYAVIIPTIKIQGRIIMTFLRSTYSKMRLTG